MNLLSDFQSRINQVSDNYLGSSFYYLDGTRVKSLALLKQFFYIYNQILRLSGIENIILECNSSLEAHIFSFFLICSNYKSYFIPEHEHSFIVSNRDSNLTPYNSVFLYFNSNTFEQVRVKSCIKCFQIIDSFAFEESTKCARPLSKDIDLFFRSTTNPGDSVFMSSGSTNTPKLIPLSFNNINSCYHNVCDGFLKEFNYDTIVSFHSTSFVIILPFLFSFANKTAHLCASRVGKEFSFSILQFSRSANIDESYLIISVPSILRSLNQLCEQSRDPLSKRVFEKTTVISCGEPLDVSLAQSLNSHNLSKFFNLYGSTEVAPWILFLDVQKYLDGKSESDLDPILPAGVPLPNTSLIINENSELLINSDSVFSGYVDPPKGQDCFQYDKNVRYYNTGDIFNISDGLYFCQGRSNSALKILGQFINPISVEAKVKQLYGYSILCAPIPIKSKVTIFIFEVSTKDPELIKLEIIPPLKALLPKGCRVSFTFIEKGAKSLTSGKIDRKYYYQLATIDND